MVTAFRSCPDLISDPGPWSGAIAEDVDCTVKRLCYDLIQGCKVIRYCSASLLHKDKSLTRWLSCPPCHFGRTQPSRLRHHSTADNSVESRLKAIMASPPGRKVATFCELPFFHFIVPAVELSFCVGNCSESRGGLLCTLVTRSPKLGIPFHVRFTGLEPGAVWELTS